MMLSVNFEWECIGWRLCVFVCEPTSDGSSRFLSYVTPTGEISLHTDI